MGPRATSRSRRKQATAEPFRRRPRRPRRAHAADGLAGQPLAGGGPLRGRRERASAALLVVGSSHRRTRSAGSCPGSTGASLLHGRPVLGARSPRAASPERDQRSLGRIGVAFDGSPEAWAALETAIGLAELRLLRALRRHRRRGAPLRLRRPPSRCFTAREYGSSEHEEKRRIQELALKRVPEGDFSAHRLPAHRRPRPPARRGGRGL